MSFFQEFWLLLARVAPTCKTLIKPLYKKGDKTECRDYRGISLVSVGSKLLGNIILFRLRDAVDKVLREE